MGAGAEVVKVSVEGTTDSRELGYVIVTVTSSGNQDSMATEYVNTAPSRIVMLVRERRKRSGSGVLEGEGEGEVVTVGLAEVPEVLDGVAERVGVLVGESLTRAPLPTLTTTSPMARDAATVSSPMAVCTSSEMEAPVWATSSCSVRRVSVP